jgi:hypothetical protein
MAVARKFSEAHSFPKAIASHVQINRVSDNQMVQEKKERER